MTSLPVVLCLLLAGSAWGAEYYVDVDSRGGPSDDAGPGSQEGPWRTLARAMSEQEPRLQAGDTIWVRGGVYQETVRIEAGGTPERPLTIKAFPRERPIIDGEGERASGVGLATLGLCFVEGLWAAWMLFALGGLFVACFWPTILAVASDEIATGSASLFALLAAAGIAGCVIFPWAMCLACASASCYSPPRWSCRWSCSGQSLA